MPELKSFFNHPYPTQMENTKSFLETTRQTIVVFDSLVDFLRSPQTFNNREINDLVAFAWRSIGNEITPTTISDVNAFGYYLDPYGFYQFGPDLPLHFVDDVKREPIMQIGRMVNIASRIRDYNIYGQPLDEAAHERAHAFEAEAILEMQKMAEAEGYGLLLNTTLQKVLGQYPEGVKSLPEGLYYPAPQTIEIEGIGYPIYPEEN